MQTSKPPTIVGDMATTPAVDPFITASPQKPVELESPPISTTTGSPTLVESLPRESLESGKAKDAVDISSSSMMVDMPIDMSPPTVDASPMQLDVQLEKATEPVPLRTQGLLSVQPPLNEQPMEVELASSAAATHPVENRAQLQLLSAGVNELESSTVPQAGLADEPTPPRLPNLLYVTVGSDTPDVSEVTFEAGVGVATAARRWCERHTTGYEYVFILLRLVLIMFGVDEVYPISQSINRLCVNLPIMSAR